LSQRQNISSGSAGESLLGYSRAVRIGKHVAVAGITANTGAGPVGGSDPAAQTREIFSRIGDALKEAGASFEDVIRTRIYLTSMSDLEAVGRIHGEVFRSIRPATAVLHVQSLATDQLLVEIEADAVLA